MRTVRTSPEGVAGKVLYPRYLTAVHVGIDDKVRLSTLYSASQTHMIIILMKELEIVFVRWRRLLSTRDKSCVGFLMCEIAFHRCFIYVEILWMQKAISK